MTKLKDELRDTLKDKLLKLGWNDLFEKQLPLDTKDLPARIVSENRGLYYVDIGLNKFLEAKPSGNLIHQATSRWDLPSIGDWCLVQLDLHGERAVIKGVLNRKSCMVRKSIGTKNDIQILASNMDYVFIVTSLNEDFNLRRIERYIALSWDSGAQPVILLTKKDLVEDANPYIREVESIAFGIPVHALSSKETENIHEVQAYFKEGTTAVLVGSSGVGKSTLTNLLLGEDILTTQEVRADDGKGKHTTTFRELFFLPQGGMIIDTPGIREVALWFNEDGLSQGFEEIEALFVNCKFTDCKHETEPKCAVKQALVEGILELERWQAYLKLRKELSYLQRKTNKALQSQEKERWKKIHQDAKVRMKLKGR